MPFKMLFKAYAYAILGILKLSGYTPTRVQGWRDITKEGVVSCGDMFKINGNKRLLIAYRLLLPWGKLLAIKNGKGKKPKAAPPSDFYPID